jgi:hypothetical protein
MADATRTRIIIAVIGIVVVITLGVTFMRLMPGEQVRTINATIVSIDAVNRTASIAFVHPKTGQTLELKGSVPPECDIQINGKPAQMSDLKSGERAEVNGTIRRDMTLSANWVRVTRAADTRPAANSSASTRPTEHP